MDYGKGDAKFLSCYNSHIRSGIYCCILKTKRMNIHVRELCARHRGAGRGVQVDANNHLKILTFSISLNQMIKIPQNKTNFV